MSYFSEQKKKYWKEIAVISSQMNVSSVQWRIIIVKMQVDWFRSLENYFREPELIAS